MCGRFAAGHLTQKQMQRIVEGFLDGRVALDEDAPAPRGGYNIRPTNRIALLHEAKGGMVLTTAPWQVPRAGGGRPMINARIESRGYWRRAWDEGRCIIPALGYYEWTGVGKERHPMYVTVKRNAPVLFFAGFRVRGGCVIVTRDPARQIAHIHNRMPVILTQGDIRAWLGNEIDPKEAQDSLGTGWDGRFEYHRVAPIANDAEGPELIEPWTPAQGGFEF